MLGKRMFENGGCSIHTLPSKLQKSKVKRSIAEDLCPVVDDTSPSDVRRPKVVAVGGSSKRCGPFASGDALKENEWHTSVDKSSYSEVISAVPLRCVPTHNLPSDCENPVAARSECVSDGKKSSKDNENKAGSMKPPWKSDLDKLTELIARAKEVIHLSNAKSNVEPKSTLETYTENTMNPSRLEGDKEDDDEVCIISPVEWNSVQQCLKHRCDADLISMERNGLSSLNQSTHKPVLGSSPSIDCQGIESVDSELIKTNFVETPCEDSSVNAEECSMGKYQEDYSKAIVKYCDTADDEEVARGIDEQMYIMNQKDLINLNIVPRNHPQAVKVRTVLKRFEGQYAQVLKELRGPGDGKSTCPHLVAAARLKAEGMRLFPEKPFGHIPGVRIGDEFRFRAELSVVGLHRQLVAGIDSVVLDGQKLATSVINSGRYENEAKALDVLIYSGQGGNQKSVEKPEDQKLVKGNLALMNSMKMQYPVRVTYKRKSLSAINSLGVNNEGNFVYVYDGLYIVKRMWQERDQNERLAFKFEMHRMSGQPRPHQVTYAKPIRQVKSGEICIADDISQGKEIQPVCAMNGLDDEGHPSFTYITNIVYPSWYQRIEPVGCDCIDGCLDSQKCSCVMKNGGEIPYNEKGQITRAKVIVHECGPLCKCPPSCMNRVTQHGPCYQLEIFKTSSRGWGVRSRDHISSGSFICEYVGELLQDKEADQRNNDEYLFDILDDRDKNGDGENEGVLGSKSNDDSFTIDAAKFGNIGRFINHSCSPNLYAQKVLYDDKRIPHIMFFATKNIPPRQELSYDYNYKIDRVCDADGNIRIKNCYCGSRKCTGRMY